MDDLDRLQFAKVLKHTTNPKDCPQYVEEIYTLLAERGRQFLGVQRVNHHDNPMIVVLAESLYKRDLMISALAERLATCEARIDQLEAETDGNMDPTDDSERPTDLRTAAGKAWKARQKQTVTV